MVNETNAPSMKNDDFPRKWPNRCMKTHLLLVLRNAIYGNVIFQWPPTRFSLEEKRTRFLFAVAAF